jgi:hypothetical protein
MKPLTKKLIPGAAILLGCLAACANWPPHRASTPQVDFAQQVKPLLESRCLECHHWRYLCAGLNHETKTLAMKGGRSGPVIMPGAPEQSLLYRVLLLGHDSPVAMPPTPERVEAEDLKILHDWILQKAPWPAGIYLEPPQDWPSTRTN